MVDRPTPLTAQAYEIKLNIATKAQLDDIARVAQAGFPDDPEWNYRFPDRKDHPKDNWKWTRREYEEFFEQPDKYTILVVATDTEDAANRTQASENAKVVAIAVWDTAPLTESKGGDLGICERRDADWRHMKAFAEALKEAFDKYFGRYKEKQYHLWLLATHPDYRRQGAGTMLCRWGMDKAKKDGYAATVFSSPMGRKLYEHLGFKSVGSIYVQAEHETEKLTVDCLEYNAGKDSSSSIFNYLLPWIWWY